MGRFLHLKIYVSHVTENNTLKWGYIGQLSKWPPSLSYVAWALQTLLSLAPVVSTHLCDLPGLGTINGRTPLRESLGYYNEMGFPVVHLLEI